MKKFFRWLLLVLTGKHKPSVDAEICDYSGQGHDRYGR